MYPQRDMASGCAMPFMQIITACYTFITYVQDRGAISHPITRTHVRASLVWYNNRVSKLMCTRIIRTRTTKSKYCRRASIATSYQLMIYTDMYKCVIEHQIHVYYIHICNYAQTNLENPTPLRC